MHGLEVHPCSRGEYKKNVTIDDIIPGSSPRVRGILAGGTIAKGDEAPLAFLKPRSVSGLEFFGFRKTELSETEKQLQFG